MKDMQEQQQQQQSEDDSEDELDHDLSEKKVKDISKSVVGGSWLRVFR